MGSVDNSNAHRIDLNEIYDETKRRAHYRAKQRPELVDQLAISGHDIKILHSFMKEGASDLATKAGMVSNASESGFDALTGDGKLEDLGTLVIYNIDDLSSERNKRTVAHELIKKALINYVLREWFDLHGMGEVAKNHYYKYKDARETIHSNRIRQAEKNDKSELRYRPLG